MRQAGDSGMWLMTMFQPPHQNCKLTNIFKIKINHFSGKMNVGRFPTSMEHPPPAMDQMPIHVDQHGIASQAGAGGIAVLSSFRWPKRTPTGGKTHMTKHHPILVPDWWVYSPQ